MLFYMEQFQERGITPISSVGKNMHFGDCHADSNPIHLQVL